MIVAGSNGELAYKIRHKSKICPIQIERLSYGEKYIRVPSRIGGKIFFINSFYPNPDEILFESRLIAETLKERGADEIIGIFPYLAYSRRSRKVIYGEAKILDIALEILEVFDKIFAIDFYGENRRVENISAMPIILEYLRRFEFEDPIIIGPDEISLNWIKDIAKVVKADYDLIKKIRIDAENVIVSTIPTDVENRDVIILDDIIATGETIIQSAKKLKELKAKRIIAAATHALFNKEVYAKMLRAGVSDVIATDTVLNIASRVSVAGLIEDIIESCMD